MEELKKFEFSVRMASSEVAISQISSKLGQIKAVTIKEAFYTTQNATSEALTVSISAFSDHTYVKTSTRSSYTKLIFLPKTNQSTVTYFNPNDEAKDVVHKQATDMYNFTIKALIDDEYTSDINDSNPLFLKLIFYYVENEPYSGK